jgi:ferric-dicitrate binding protein FerR (iron transport regulator)
MRTPIDFKQLDRFLSGESSADEQERIARRADQDPELRQLLNTITTSVRSESGTWNTDQAWSDLQNRGQQRRKALWRPGLAAAALLVLAVGIAVVYRGRTGDGSEQISSAAQEYRTARGEQRDITLSDASKIVLSAGSSVRVPADFAENRTVRLEGEAFFDVEPDASRPFTVLSGPARTRVLGTAFNVSTHPGGAVEVAVVNGRVELRHDAEDGSGAVLNPGQAGRLQGNAEIVVRTVDVNDYIAWRQGRLVFRDVSLSEVTATLERWYEVDLEIGDATLAQQHVTAFFEKQNLNEVLDVLAETLDARYERTGSRTTFLRK